MFYQHMLYANFILYILDGLTAYLFFYEAP